MNFDEVKKQLEQEGNSKNGSIVDSMPYKFFEPFIVQGIKVDLVEPGRVICSMIVPPRLLVCYSTPLSCCFSSWFIYVDTCLCKYS